MQYTHRLRTASRRLPSRGWLAVCVCAVAALFLVGVVRAGAPNLGGPARLVGRIAPDFALEAAQIGNASPERISLSNYHGQVVILVFVNSLCVHCGVTAQTVAGAADGTAATQTIFIDSPAETASIAAEYAQRLGIDAPMLLDPDGATAAAYGVTAYPVTLLIDGTGIIRGAWSGEVNGMTLSTALDALAKR